MPSRLRRGIAEIREILLNSGYKVLVGDRRWEKRLKALGTPWPPVRMSAEEFNLHVQAFWQKAVWIAKKIARPEPRSAMHWMHKLILEHVYALLEEEAWLTGRSARPEALKSEKWLDTRRLQQTAIETGIDPAGLAKTLLLEIELFKDVCASVASRQGFAVKDHGAVKAWLEAELKRIAAESIAG